MKYKSRNQIKADVLLCVKTSSSTSELLTKLQIIIDNTNNISLTALELLKLYAA